MVVVPSHYSSLSRIADHLDRQGYDVLDVADDDWDPVAALLPYIRSADVVVCSGYSTIMDAAVAGTPRVVHPATDEQDAVADCLERFDVDGFAIAEEPLDVLDAVADPPAAPSFQNGADNIARRVLTDLRDPDPSAAPEPNSEPETDAGSIAGTVGTLAAVSTLAAVCATTATSTAAPSRLARGVAGALAQCRRVSTNGLATCRSGTRDALARCRPGGFVSSLRWSGSLVGRSVRKLT